MVLLEFSCIAPFTKLRTPTGYPSPNYDEIRSFNPLYFGEEAEETRSTRQTRLCHDRFENPSMKQLNS